MKYAYNDNSLSSNQDTNRFLVYVGIEPQISYSTIRDFTKGMFGTLNVDYNGNDNLYYRE